MTRNVAIIISVSEYENEQVLSPLPACQRDSDLILAIIRAANKYDDYLLIDNSPYSFEAKQRLTNKISEWQGSQIGEVFFYYSGHGLLCDGEFLFPFRNYHSADKFSSSLRNNELDALLRSLSPSVAVKVIDACHSGTEYIKSEPEIKEAMNTSTPNFNNLYFFYSSGKEQRSYVDGSYSYFTQSYASSLITQEGRDIRYYDIINHIQGQRFPSGQKPFYVIQALATEVFCHVTTELTAAVKEKISACDPENPQNIPPSPDKEDLPRDEAFAEDSPEADGPLMARIRAVSGEYQTKEQAINILDLVKTIVEQYQFASTIEQCYRRNLVLSESIPHLSSLRKVAKWLQDFGEDFFASIAYEEEEYEGYEKVEYVDEPSEFTKKFLGTSSLFSPIKKKVKTEPVRKVRNVASGYSLPPGYSFACMHILLEPLYAALPKQDVYVLPILSARKIRLFYKQETRKKVDFDSDITSDLKDWASSESFLTPSSHAEDLARDAMRYLERSILSAIEIAAEQ